MQIRVFCRVRPGAESAVTCMPDGLTVRVDGQTEGIKEGAKDCTFAFDKVFGHYSSQADVFAEVSDMVQSALDGYKVMLSCCADAHAGKPRQNLNIPLHVDICCWGVAPLSRLPPERW